MQRPNTTIDDVCATIGFSATIRLVGWFGGSNVYVPEQVDDGHKLAAVLGISAARALCSEFGSQTIWVPADPAGDRRRSYEVRKSVAKALLKSNSTQAVAEDLGLSVRQVQRIKKELEEGGLLPSGV